MMTDTKLLDEFIEKSGLRPGYICDRLQISKSSWSLKRRNKVRFNVEEINLLCRLLNITKLTDKEAIFFASEVE